MLFEIGSHIVLYSSEPTIRIKCIITRSHICISFTSIITTCNLVDLLITSFIGTLIIILVGLTTNADS